MTKPLKILHATRVIARVVLELTAPMSIGTGEPGDAADNALVLDANGLPGIPGTSLAGVLRSSWSPPRAVLGDDEKGAAFGYQDLAKPNTTPEAQRSLVRASWGVIHGSDDTPVVDLRLPSALAGDAVLEAAQIPIVRDHVRINHRGTVDTTGKFTRASVMAGHRFTAELETSGAHADALMDELIATLQSPQTRLGGRTRAGLGAFILKRGERRRYDLNEAADLAAWIERPICLKTPLTGGQPITIAPQVSDVLTLTLTPTEPWQIGAGDGDGVDAVQNKPKGAHAEQYAPDILPYTEQRIEWEDGPEPEGYLSAPELVLPASSIKGALRHRTAFYLRQAAPEPDYAKIGMDEVAWAAKDLAGITALFGEVNDKDEDKGKVGLLFIDDVRVPIAGLLSTTHVSIDRFTGSPLSGHLFTDISVDAGTPITVTMWRDLRERRPHLAEALRALERAIGDLCSDQLQLGAGAGRGYGYFEGSATHTPNWFTEAEQ